MSSPIPYIHYSAGCVSAILPGAAEYIMTGQLTPFIAGGVGVAGGLLTYAILTWWHKRKSPQIVPPSIVPGSSFDRFIVWTNPGNHAAVIRLIVKADTVDAIDSLFDNYINSVSHHRAYEIDVVTVHYLKKTQLLRGDDRQKWYMGERRNILQRHGYAQDRLIRAMSDTWEKYPELNHWD